MGCINVRLISLQATDEPDSTRKKKVISLGDASSRTSVASGSSV